MRKTITDLYDEPIVVGIRQDKYNIDGVAAYVVMPSDGGYLLDGEIEELIELLVEARQKLRIAWEASND